MSRPRNLSILATNVDSSGILGISSGGTGASTASTALTALGAYAATNPSGYTSNAGTVTSVAALTLGTAGTDVSSTVATNTTTPVITLNIPTASASNRGVLSAADWTTFNNKQSAVTTLPNPNAVTFAAAGGAAAGSSYTGAATLTVDYTTVGAAASSHTHSYQAADGDLLAIAGLTGTSGLLKKTAVDTWILDTTAYYSASNVPPYPAEADTLQTVTTRGATTSNAITLSYGTANGVAYLDASKVLTSGSALTFDGTNLTNTGTGTFRSLVLNGVGTSQLSTTDASGLYIDANTTAGMYLQSGGNFIFRASTSGSYAEYMRLTSTGLGIGTTTSTSKLTVAGAGTFNALETLSYTSNTGTTISNPTSLLLSPTFTGTGAANVFNYTALSAPTMVATSTGGASTNAIYGYTALPTITSSDAGARISLYGFLASSTRANTNDLSSQVNNVVVGGQFGALHGTTLPSTAYSAALLGTNSTVQMQAGSAASAESIRAQLLIGSVAGTSATVTSAYAFTNLTMTIGSASGTVTVTNLYGLYLVPPTVGASATITNRYGVYSGDTLGTNYFAGNIGVGTTSPNGRLTVFNSATFDARTSGINVHRPSAYGQYGSFAYDSNATIFSSTYTGGGAGNYGQFIFQAYDSTTTPVTRLVLDPSGNLGLGVTPSAWSGSTALQLPNLSAFSAGYDYSANLTFNVYRSAATYYAIQATIGPSRYALSGGGHNWYTYNGTVTAGAAIAFTQSMTLDANGKLGIGTTSPSAKLHVNSGSVDTPIRTDTTVAYNFISLVNSTGNAFIGSNGNSLLFQPAGTTQITLSSTAMTLENSLILNAGTANGVGYLNASKVLTTGSALTFNGTALGITGTTSGVRTILTATTGSAYTQYSNNSGSFFVGKENSAGDSFGAPAYASVLYESGGYPIVFYTDATERMRITSAGNVGIGTSSPGYKLQIQGTASAVSGTAKAVVMIDDTTAMAANVGGAITLRGKYDTAGNYAAAAYIQAQKANATSGDDSFALTFGTRNSGYSTAEVMRLDSAGNLGLGVTPSAWASSKAIEVGYSGSAVWATAVNDVRISSNLYFNGTNAIYSSSSLAGQYRISGGVHYWYNAPSGTAGNAITFTQAMTLVGTSTPSLLVGTTSDFSGFNFQAKNQVGFSVHNSADSATAAYFSAAGNVTLTAAGSSAVLNGVDGILLGVGGSERARIDASGNLLVGTTTQKVTTVTGGATGLTIGAAGAPTIALWDTDNAAYVGYWSQINAEMYFGNNANGPILFGTNSTTKMTLDASGKLGIGTTSPSGVLDIRASGAVQQYIISTSATNQENAIVSLYNNGTAYSSLNFDTADYKFKTSGTERMRITSAGRVGIANTSPSVDFEIGSDTSTTRVLSIRYSSVPGYISGGFDGAYALSTFSNNAWSVATGAAQTWSASSNTGYTTAGMQLASSGSASEVRFFTTGTANSAPTERVRIDASGNLIVGNTSALVSAASRGNVTINGTTSSILSLGVGGSYRTYLYTDGTNTELWNGQAGYMIFGTSGSERVRIESAGNVGIGTSSPSEKLHVANGRILVTGTGYTANPSGAVLGYYSGAGTATSYLQAPSAGRVQIWNGGTSAIATFDANSNVGIGTETPTYKLQVVGSFAATTKSFVIDHPTKPGMKLRYGSLEGPENGVYIRGRLKGNKIELPEYWTKLVDPDSITVNLTAIGKSQDIYVEDIVDNVVYVGGENVNCFYTVFAERVDVAKLEVEVE